MWKDFYQSYWQHPGILVLLPLLVFLFLSPIKGWLRGFLLFFTAETILDVLITGPFLREFQLTDSSIATVLSISFVVLGDLRIYLLGFYLWGKRGVKNLYLAALGMSLVVPCLQALAIKTFPNVFDSSHAIYLVYELIFLSVALSLSTLKKTRWLFLWASLYYALWATADIIILLGVDLGFALRVLPNLLYYGLTVVWVAWRLSPRKNLLRPEGKVMIFLSLCGAACLLIGCKSKDCVESRNVPTHSLLLRKGEPTAPSSGLVHQELELTTTQDGQEEAKLQLESMLNKLSSMEVRSFDPHYGKNKSFRAFPLSSVLRLAFGNSHNEPFQGEVHLIANDGYQVKLDAKLAMHPDAYLAFADLEFPLWEPVGAKKVSPGPFYLIWQGLDYPDLNAYPRPWGVVSIDYRPKGKPMPHLLPAAGLKSEQAQHGHKLFLAECVHCHAINREGGKVGPELNVPMNILSYRTEDQVRRFIENPQQFRPSVMPPHPQFQERDYQGILAYFRVMADHQVLEVEN